MALRWHHQPMPFTLLAIVNLSMSSACAGERLTSQKQLDAISAKCGLPLSALTLRGQDTLQFQPSEDTKFESIDCALKEIKAAQFPGLKMGFVGNEQYESEAK